MEHRVVRLLAALAAAGLVWAAATAQEATSGGVSAVLELNRQFYYAGESLLIRVSVGHDGPERVANPVKGPLWKGFQVSRDGKPLKSVGQPEGTDEVRPDKLAPNAFYGRVVDLTGLFPGLGEVGTYEIRWSFGGVEAPAISLQVIPRYDPEQTYRGVLETGEGPIVIEFFKEASPVAVKNFIDLAHVGFYDGLSFHEVRKDWLVAGGDPTGTGMGGAGYSFPAETSPLPVVAGTVLMKPVSPTPPSNSSQFIILLRPEPAWTGQFTVLGQVVAGLDVVRRISRKPSTMQGSRPFFKPLEEIRVDRLRVETVADSSPDGGSSTEP